MKPIAILIDLSELKVDEQGHCWAKVVDAPSLWISVKDQLPAKFEKSVLVYAPHSIEQPLDLSPEYFVAEWDGENFYELIDLCTMNVTHWMPLPGVPEE